MASILDEKPRSALTLLTDVDATFPTNGAVLTWSAALGKAVWSALLPAYLRTLGASWPLEEASGTRFDLHGTRHLTEVGTVPRIAGKIGFGASFTGNVANYLTTPYTPTAFVGGVNGAFTIAAWVQLNDKTVNRAVISQVLNGFTLIYRVASDRFEFFLNNGTTIYTVIANVFGSPAINTLNFIVAWYDPTGPTLNIRINNGRLAAGAADSVAGPASYTAQVSSVDIGRHVGANAMHGLIDSVTFWNGVLTAADQSALYDSIRGLAYPHDAATTAFTLGTSLATNGYKDTSVNTSNTTYRLVSRTVLGAIQQVYAYWNYDGYLVIKHRVNAGAWATYTYDNTAGNPNGAASPIGPVTVDNHNLAVCGIDPNGVLHISYDMHVVALKYRKSTVPLASFAGVLTAQLTMVNATWETTVTYPMFINDPAGNLYFLYRRASSGDGDLYMYQYTHATALWSVPTGAGANGLIISGQPDDVSPYWHRAPSFDSDFGSGGFLHLGWSWRNALPADGNANHDVSYARWNGTAWSKSTAAAQTVPITFANCEIIDPVVTATGLKSIGGIDSDSNRRPHLSYWKNDARGLAQLYHTWHNGTAWVVDVLTTNTTIVSAGDGAGITPNQTLLNPILLVNRTTNEVLIITNSAVDGVGLYARRAIAPYTAWTKVTVFANNPGSWVPMYDRRRWEVNKVVEMAVEVYFTPSYELPIKLVEWTPG